MHRLLGVHPTNVILGHKPQCLAAVGQADRKSTRLNSSHQIISYAVFCLKKKKKHVKSNNHIISKPILSLTTTTSTNLPPTTTPVCRRDNTVTEPPRCTHPTCTAVSSRSQ